MPPGDLPEASPYLRLPELEADGRPETPCVRRRIGPVHGGGPGEGAVRFDQPPVEYGPGIRGDRGRAARSARLPCPQSAVGTTEQQRGRRTRSCRYPLIEPVRAAIDVRERGNVEVSVVPIPGAVQEVMEFLPSALGQLAAEPVRGRITHEFVRWQALLRLGGWLRRRGSAGLLEQRHDQSTLRVSTGPSEPGGASLDFSARPLATSARPAEGAENSRHDRRHCVLETPWRSAAIPPTAYWDTRRAMRCATGACSSDIPDSNSGPPVSGRPLGRRQGRCAAIPARRGRNVGTGR